MEFTSAISMPSGYTLTTDKDAREAIVVVVKGTFDLVTDGSIPKLSKDQISLVESDEFFGEPGFSCTKYESEYAPFKPRCDVLLNGSAYAPGGKPTKKVDVGLRVSSVNKVFTVVGDRYWRVGAALAGATDPEPFEIFPFSYDVAFGGVDDFHQDEEKRDAYMPNPTGTGFHKYKEKALVNDTPLPNTEEKKKTVTSPFSEYRPMSFGVVGRSWPDRAKYAGTYNEKWMEKVFPFLPEDFDDRYFQAAPDDQQCDYLVGGERVELLNLTPNGRTTFVIPEIEIPVAFFPREGAAIRKEAVLDTLFIEPDEHRFSLVWRCQQKLSKNIFEIEEILVGKKSQAWWRARILGKEHHDTLSDLILSKSESELDDE